MFKTINHYWQVYKKFVATSAAVNMSFRTSFILLVLMDVFFFLGSLASVDFIYNHITTIGPWNREQLMFFISFMLAVDNLHMMLISESFWALSFDIRTGAFDYTVLKPLHTIFTCFFRFFRPSSLVGFFFIWGVLIHYGRVIGLSPFDWLLLPLLVVLALLLLVTIEFTLSVSMFWLTEGLGINFLRMQMQHLARWPNFVYGPMARKVLTICLPILLIGSAPVHFLYDSSKWEYLIYMLLAIAAGWAVLLPVWKIGVRHYDSASS